MLQKLLESINSQFKKTTVWVIIYYDNQILLGKRSKYCNNPGQWNFPGGTIDSGEAPIDAAIRECFEETNLKINKSQLNYIGKAENSFYYFVKLNNISSLKLTKETEKYKLIKKQFPKNLHYSVKLFLRNF